MSRPYEPSTPLEQQIVAADQNAVVATLRALTVEERRKERAALARLSKLMKASRFDDRGVNGVMWLGRPTDEQLHAAGTALAVCGDADDLASVDWADGDALVALAREFDLPGLAGFADAALARSTWRTTDVQALVAAGLIPRPDSDAYALGLLALADRCRNRGEVFETYFTADPGLADVALRVLDVEGTSDLNLAGLDKYAANYWGPKLRSLCAEGRFSRDTLLSRVLSTLSRDWPQFRAGWFSRFHGEIAPTPAEMAPHAARYLALLSSRIPPTVTLALEAVAALDAAGHLDAADLARALVPVMASGNKKQLDAALKRFDAIVARDPGLRETAALAVCGGLVLDAPDLLKKILDRVDAWGVTDAVRVELEAHAPGIAASQRARVAALLGEVAPTASAQPMSAVPAVTVTVLDASRRLAPPEDVHRLVEAVAHVFEHGTDVDTFEQVAAALVQRAPLSGDVIRAFGPVMRRAGRVRTPVAAELARLLVFVVDGRRTDRAVFDDLGESPMYGVLADRIDGFIALAAQGHGLVPLASPTHHRGFIDPAALVERVRLHVGKGAKSPVDEQALALLRLAPGANVDVRLAARALADTPFTRALRHALGDDVAADGDPMLWAAAARARHPGADDPALAPVLPGDPDGARVATYTWRIYHRTHTVSYDTYHFVDLMVDVVPARRPQPLPLASRRHPGLDPELPYYRTWGWLSFSGQDEGLVHLSATLVPSDLSAHFAEGARAIGNNIDWSEARWHDRAYLALLLDPTVPPSPMAQLLLAVALAGREPGQTALAVDAFVAMWATGRLDETGLQEAMTRLLAEGGTKAARWRKSFEATLRIEPAMAGTVIRLVTALLRARPEEPPKDTAGLLELLNEQLAATGTALNAEGRAAVGALVLGGRGKVLQKALLAG